MKILCNRRRVYLEPSLFQPSRYSRRIAARRVMLRPKGSIADVEQKFFEANVQKTLALQDPVNHETRLRANSEGAPRWTVLIGIQTLRQAAENLRERWQVQAGQFDAGRRSADADNLLQKASILERGADVLAVTSEDMIRLATIR